jgi:CubicO group peptidase (beta-lactamase class C family)
VVEDGTITGVTSDVLVPWWSITKLAIAAAALRLVEGGEFMLDAPFPARPYTLRQLLQHRAGLRDYGPLAAYHDAVARGDSPWDAVDRIPRRTAAAFVSTDEEGPVETLTMDLAYGPDSTR